MTFPARSSHTRRVVLGVVGRSCYIAERVGDSQDIAHAVVSDVRRVVVGIRYARFVMSRVVRKARCCTTRSRHGEKSTTRVAVNR